MRQKNSERNLNHSAAICFSALMAAIVIIMTAYILHIPIGVSSGGYIHLGDAFICLAACLLPQPYALAVGAVGAGVADLLTAPVWAPASVIIKILMTLAFKSDGKILCRRNVIVSVQTIVLTVAGYYLAEVILFSNWKTPLVSVPFNAAQGIGSAVVFIIMGAALDKAGIRSMMNRFLYRN